VKNSKHRRQCIFLRITENFHTELDDKSVLVKDTHDQHKNQHDSNVDDRTPAEKSCQSMD
jgi:hypothetical protein